MSPRSTKKPKSYLNPKPEPTAMSFKESNPENVARSSSISSKTFQMFPASTNKAPFKSPNRLKRCSALRAILKLASLNSLVVFKLPGPKLYAVQALLSLAPPAKKLFEKGMLVEFPYGIAIPTKHSYCKNVFVS